MLCVISFPFLSMRRDISLSACSLIIADICSQSATGWPSIARILSPFSRCAWSAGVPGTTFPTWAFIGSPKPIATMPSGEATAYTGNVSIAPSLSTFIFSMASGFVWSWMLTSFQFETSAPSISSILSPF